MEHEDRREGQICFTCKWFKEGGWCTRRPRLAQKWDDRTDPTNWCQYYEENMERMSNLEAAIAAVKTAEVNRAIENIEQEIKQAEADAETVAEDSAEVLDTYETPPLPHRGETEAASEVTYTQAEVSELLDDYCKSVSFNAGVKELRALSNALINHKHTLRDSAADFAESGARQNLDEVIGMMKITANLQQQIEARIEQLEREFYMNGDTEDQ